MFYKIRLKHFANPNFAASAVDGKVWFEHDC